MRKTLGFLLTLVLTAALSAAPPSKNSVSTKAKPAGTLAPVNLASLPPAANAALKSIDGERIRAHVKFLSDDLLEGRGTGQRGGDIAAKYIAAQFALDGLAPAGDNGTFLQKVPLVGITTQPESTVSLLPPQKSAIDLRLSDDVVAMDETQAPVSDLESELIYVGYGIKAPEYNWDDYKNTDVRGKVLLMLVNEPPSDDPKFFKGAALTYYGRWTYKFEEAARRGAAGVLLIHKTDMASYGWDVVRNSWSGERSYLRNESGQKLKLAAWIQLEIAKKLASDAGQDLDKLLEQAKSRDFRPLPLPVKVKAHMVSKVRPFDSNNVLAMLPGSDPKLKEQAVLYTAHYDHLGIHPEMKGDNIYNGALDNATGCGVLLEMARAFSAAAEKPRRSVLFAAVTAEEQGLRGSEYLGQHPPIPAGKITLDLNFDGVEPYGIPEEVQVAGSERTSFYPTVEATAKEFNLKITPDSDPGAGHYYRSDHFSLARVGIPGFSVSEGLKFKGHTRQWGEDKKKDYNQHRYHQPTDEYQPDWDFSADAYMARFGVALGWKAANAAQLAQWHPGDEFEAARKASEKRAGGAQAQQ